MREHFNLAVEFVLVREGGYVNDPNDLGGETKFGISKRKYPDIDIKNLTIEKAKDIYYNFYWTKFNCDALPWPLSLIHFDTHVNMLPEVAEKILLRSRRFPQWYLDARRGHYAAIVAANPDKGRYLKGWLNRVNELEKLL